MSSGEKTVTATSPEEFVKAALGTQIDHIIRAEAHAEEKKSESRLAEEAVRKSVTEGKRLHAGLVALIPGTEPDYDKYVREFKRANHR